jgi:hypothetical protein
MSREWRFSGQDSLEYLDLRFLDADHMPARGASQSQIPAEAGGAYDAAFGEPQLQLPAREVSARRTHLGSRCSF